MSDQFETKYQPYKRKRFGKIELRRADGSLYLTRWYLLRFPSAFSIRLHHIVLPDIQEPHDHPYSFLSIILRGGYDEVWSPPVSSLIEHYQNATIKKVRRFSFHRGDDLHKIMNFPRKNGTWNILITGPENRTWGFMSNYGWISHKEVGAGGVL